MKTHNMRFLNTKSKETRLPVPQPKDKDMPYTVHIATEPGLNADYDPLKAPQIGAARTIRAAIKLAQNEWQPGRAFTVRDRNNHCIRTVWENGTVT